MFVTYIYCHWEGQSPEAISPRDSLCRLESRAYGTRM